MRLHRVTHALALVMIVINTCFRPIHGYDHRFTQDDLSITCLTVTKAALRRIAASQWLCVTLKIELRAITETHSKNCAITEIVTAAKIVQPSQISQCPAYFPS